MGSPSWQGHSAPCSHSGAQVPSIFLPHYHLGCGFMLCHCHFYVADSGKKKESKYKANELFQVEITYITSVHIPLA